MTVSSRSGRARMSPRSLDLHQQLLELGDDLVLLESREAIQAQVENRLGLRLRKPVAFRLESELVGETVGPRR